MGALGDPFIFSPPYDMDYETSDVDRGRFGSTADLKVAAMGSASAVGRWSSHTHTCIECDHTLFASANRLPLSCAQCECE